MKVTDYIHALKIPFSIKLPNGVLLKRFVYAHLIFGRKIYLIDSGVSGAEKDIFDYIEKQGRRPAEISLLILTHSHPDHIGSAARIKEHTGCKIAAHAAEKNWIEDTELQFRERPVPDFMSLVAGPVTVDRTLADKDEIWLEEGLDLHILHTPGHSRGSVSLLMPKNKALFSGDSIFIPGDLPIYTDFNAAENSIQRLKNIIGLECLLSSWDKPRAGEDVYESMDKALLYLGRIHETVREIARKTEIRDPMQLCKKVVAKLGLGAETVNPLTARSFQANVKALLKE